MGNEADYFFLFFCRKWADDVGNTVSSCSQRIVFFSKKLRNGTLQNLRHLFNSVKSRGNIPIFDTRQGVRSHIQAIGKFNLRHTQNFPSLNDRISKYFSESLYFTFCHIVLLFGIKKGTVGILGLKCIFIACKIILNIII